MGEIVYNLQHLEWVPQNPFAALFSMVRRLKAAIGIRCGEWFFGENGSMTQNSNQLITAKEACAMLRVGHSFFYENMVNRNLLKPVKLSKKCVRYRLSEITRVIESKTQTEHEPYGY